MRQLHYHLKLRAGAQLRLFSLVNVKKIAALLALLALLAPPQANAAVPTAVVLFDANTAFETSLETFMFDLFNTLQRRQEDFTAAFELQKIEKAREDVNKLFQETQEELQNFGLALEQTTNDGIIRDPRLPAGKPSSPGGPTPNCKNGDYSGDNAGCPPLISPLKDSRIIHDPYQYLFGDAYTKAQLFAYCLFNYLIWDQEGWLKDVYPSLPADPYAEEKSTYAFQQKTVSGMSPHVQSVEWLKATRNGIVASLQANNYYLLNYPLYNIYGYVDKTHLEETEQKCRQVMYAVGGNSPVTIENNVKFLKTLNERSDLNPNFNVDADLIRQQISFLPTLKRGISGRPVGDGYSLEEAGKVTDTRNTKNGVLQMARDAIEGMIQQTVEEREATYIAGQGFRPEYLYTTQNGASSSNPLISNSSFQLNTEYIISPAAILLQKMQAANQAMFDLAGQGFLYLDSDDTDSAILAKYRLATTATQSAERRICNQAGSCALLDPWLKPAASFRTAAAFHDVGPATGQPGPATRVPTLIGPSPDYANSSKPGIAGSGLPAPWEDPADFLNISNEKDAGNPNSTPPTRIKVNGEDINTRRYTVSRFRLFNRAPGEDAESTQTAGRDELDIDPLLRSNFRDNIGRPFPGADYPTNDWYDRVLEMYEAGIGVSQSGNSERNAKLRDFTVRDWQCYIATWFLRQNAHKAQNANFDLFIGDAGIATDQTAFVNKYCGI